MAIGATISIETLVKQRHHAKKIAPTTKSKALSQLAGDSKSQFRGRGLDFEEVRHYQAGDEVRSIDWRVTARSNTPHTKIFREERERPVLVVVDQRKAMAFGSQQCFKSVQAAELTALLCWATLNNQDRIGGLVFNDITHQEFRPARSRSSVLNILHAVQTYNQQLVTDESTNTSIEPNENVNQINTVLKEVRRIAKPGTIVFLISDFSGLDIEGLKQLYQIKRHCEVTALVISDPMEQHLPNLGFAHFTNGEQRLGLNVNVGHIKQRFLQRYNNRMEKLKNDLMAHSIPFIPVSTHHDAADLLKYYYQPGHHNSSMHPYAN